MRKIQRGTWLISDREEDGSIQVFDVETLRFVIWLCPICHLIDHTLNVFFCPETMWRDAHSGVIRHRGFHRKDWVPIQSSLALGLVEFMEKNG